MKIEECIVFDTSDYLCIGTNRDAIVSDEKVTSAFHTARVFAVLSHTDSVVGRTCSSETLFLRKLTRNASNDFII